MTQAQAGPGRRRPGPAWATLALFVLGLASAGRGALVLLRAGQLWRALAGAQAELAGPIVIGFVLLVVGCERIWPAVPRPLAARGHLHDACYLVVFALAVTPFVTLIGVGIASTLASYAPALDLGVRAGVPGWLGVGLALVAMDGFNWLAHLADHRVEALWRVHALHHSQEQLSVLTTFRNHPLGHVVSSFAASLPVVALLGDRPVTPVLITGYLVLGALPHANLAWSFGPVGKLVVSPAYHRLHHRLDGSTEVNLAIVLPLWDVLAGRALFLSPSPGACATGLGGRPLAVEQDGERYRPARLLVTQLVEPFGSLRPRRMDRAAQPVEGAERAAEASSCSIAVALARSAGRYWVASASGPARSDTVAMLSAAITDPEASRSGIARATSPSSSSWSTRAKPSFLTTSSASRSSAGSVIVVDVLASSLTRPR